MCQAIVSLGPQIEGSPTPALESTPALTGSWICGSPLETFKVGWVRLWVRAFWGQMGGQKCRELYIILYIIYI